MSILAVLQNVKKRRICIKSNDFHENAYLHPHLKHVEGAYVF